MTFYSALFFLRPCCALKPHQPKAGHRTDPAVVSPPAPGKGHLFNRGHLCEGTELNIQT